MIRIKHIFASTALSLCAAIGAQADTWVLDGAASHLAFGSIKKNEIGETHTFSGLSGFVDAEGSASIEIDLNSVQTNIDIRNERMIEHVFKSVGTATIDMEFDKDELGDLAVGETGLLYVEGNLSLLGTDVFVDGDMFVARLSESQVMVTSNDLIWLGVEDAGITAGIDKLMELAKLPSITRVSPVTLRFIFNASDQKS